MKSYQKFLIGFTLTLSFVIFSIFTWIYSQINSSLPKLDGKVTIYGLEQQSKVERDQQGLVTITANSRQDVAVATGFIHAQERFFQMDLLRKNSAGELASLFGALALNHDKKVRVHRFRDRARKIVNQLPKQQLSILKAYTQGVNQGLDSLKAKPFEYLLLGQEPAEWHEEDTVLTVLSMYMDLQKPDGDRERSLGLIASVLGSDVYAFLNPKGSKWDAAIDGTSYQPSPMPERPWPSASSGNDTTAAITPSNTLATVTDFSADLFPGSNNWAVGGTISQTKSAIIANDMHLGIRVPNTWFRASINYNANGQAIEVHGVTLPGTPNVIAGSNTNIAWGFTNSYGDWSDVVIVETNDDQSQYLTKNGYKDFTYHTQMIAVKDANAVEITIKETQWGPIIGENHLGQPLAYRWVAHDAQAVNLVQIELEQATSVDQAFEIASRTGIPAQNLVVGDTDGNIGWTVMGPIPQKFGGVGELPQSWARGEHGWNGYLTAQDYPKVKNPHHSRLWTANSRVVGEEMLAKVGNGGYALGARSSQIKAKLFQKQQFSEQDLLDVALDDEAFFIQSWQKFLLDRVLTTEAIKDKALWQQAKTILAEDTPLHASVDSVAYRIARNYRIAVRDLVFQQLNESLEQLDEGYNFRSIRNQIEAPLWQMVNQQPENFLWLSGLSWPDILHKALDDTLAAMTDGQALVEATWGQQNTTQIQHPLSRAVPVIGRWLDMPNTPLPGDSQITRVQGKGFGASERMIVSPGFEHQAILHMPTSQAGHPWSPYYGVGHSDWEQGKPSPLLPGETKYTLTLLSY
mgnify:CR=1 FL=1